MRNTLVRSLVGIAVALSALTVAVPAAADDVKLVGAITKITLAADGKSAVAILKDNKDGNAVTVNVTDDLTLDKFKDKRIVVGDEIRARFDNAGGKNLSKSFKKTAGC